MNILGLNISFSNNNKYVRRLECHQAQDAIRGKIDQLRLELKDDISKIHSRIDEIFVILVEKK